MNPLDLKDTGMLNEDGSINYDSNKFQPLHVNTVSLGGNQYYLTTAESELNSWYNNPSLTSINSGSNYTYTKIKTSDVWDSTDWATTSTAGQSSSVFYRNIYKDIPKTYEMECKCCGHKTTCNSEDYRLDYVCDDCKNSPSPVRGIISKYLRSLSLMT